MANEDGSRISQCLEAFVRSGTDALAHDLADQLIREASSLEGAAGVAEGAIGALLERGTPGALTQVHFLARESGEPYLMELAQRALQNLARRRGLRIWEIEDEIVPTCGLESYGRELFDDGVRRYTLHLDDALTPYLRDVATHERFRELGVGASAQDVREWHAIRANLEDALPLQVKRLEQALITQYRWQADHWRRWFWEHPLMGLLAQRLIWGEYSDSGRLQRTFRIDEENDLLDAADEPFQLDTSARIGIVHAFSMNAEIRAAWGRVLTDYQIVTLCPLFDRGRWPLASDRRKDLAWPVDVRGPEKLVFAWLLARGWTRERHRDEWIHLSKVFRAADIEARAQIACGPVEEIVIADVSFRRHFGFPRHVYELRDVDPIVFSETLSELDLLRAELAELGS